MVAGCSTVWSEGKYKKMLKRKEKKHYYIE